MSRRRWVCPNGCGNNVLAPGRMRKENVLRYCLPCSEKTGKLVERIVPARERKNRKKEEARREAAKAEREAKREETAHIRAAKAARKKAARLSVWKREGVSMRESWLAIRDGKVGHGRAGRTGFAVAGRDSTDTWNAIIVVHEMTHIALYRTRSARGWKGHGQAFRGLYLAAVSEYFGIDERDVLAAWKRILDAGTGRLKAYDLDSAVYRVVTDSEAKPVWRPDVLTEEAKERAAAKAKNRRGLDPETENLARAYAKSIDLEAGEADSARDSFSTKPATVHGYDPGLASTYCRDSPAYWLYGPDVASAEISCSHCLRKLAKEARRSGFKLS